MGLYSRTLKVLYHKRLSILTSGDRVRWAKVAEKAAAVFGCVFLLTVTSEEFILPVVGLHA